MRLIEVIATTGHREAIVRPAREHEALDVWTGHEDEQARQAVRILVPANHYPALLNALEARLHSSRDARPVDATLPRIEEKTGEEKEKTRITTSREELYADVSQGARQSMTAYIVLWFVSLAVLIVIIYTRHTL
ncbi:MAG: hypothetical protein R6X15_01280 [Pseudomonadota bacterium]